jgi:[ribosomal protein S5]-alanine N-acetyltransferase
MVRHLPFFIPSNEGSVMSCQLNTERLLLRPPELKDVAAIVAGIGEWEVAKNLGRAPYPYREEFAYEFIGKQTEARAKGTDFAFMAVRKEDDAMMGCCGVHLRESGAFEVGYWLGKPYWGQGYATEAARKVCGFAFHVLKAERLAAGWFHDNPASGHVLEKVGFVTNGSEQRNCAARGHTVYCNMMLLERENFGRRKQAA